jgi:hypothetical protein
MSHAHVSLGATFARAAMSVLGGVLVACTGVIGDLADEAADSTPTPTTLGQPPAHEPTPSTTPRPSAPALPSVATCGGVPSGRRYVSLLGGAREADRVDQALGLERDMPVINTRWYQLELEQRLYEIFQSYPHGELFRGEGVTGTFNGVRPDRSFARISQGPLTAVKLFELSFQICLLEIASRRGYSLWDHDRYQASPTAEGAEVFCTRVLTGALRRAPTADELGECTTYATEDVLADPVPARQWAYVCGMIGATTTSWTR